MMSISIAPTAVRQLIGQRKVSRMDNIDKVKYIVCCPFCDNPKCVKGTDRCEAEVWKRKKGKEGEQNDKP